ncbi:MAG: crossover junction endodeoxyribonuclease RuvC [Phycisphaerales bacterium]
MKSTQADGGWISVEERARVLGIDPGTRIAGYAVVDFDRRGEATIVDAGVLRMTESASLPLRLRQLFDDVAAVIAEHAPSHMALESVFSHAEFVRSAITLAHARGVVMLAAETRGVPIAELPPAEVKKAVTGSGRATKEQMQRAVMSQCGLATMPEPPDVADAIAIALCGGRRLRGLA